MIYTNGTTSICLTYTNHSVWNKSGNNIFNREFTGNVGIGTTNPASVLDVEGTINASALNVSGDTHLATQSGRVGIGTSSPDVNLHVFDSSQAQIYIESEDSSTFLHLISADPNAGGVVFWDADNLRWEIRKTPDGADSKFVISGDVEAIETPIGFIPKYENLKELFADIDKDYPKEIYDKQFTLYIDRIIGRIDLQEEAYKKEKNIPAKLFEVYEEQRKGLEALKAKYGPTVSVEQLMAQ